MSDEIQSISNKPINKIPQRGIIKNEGHRPSLFNAIPLSPKGTTSIKLCKIQIRAGRPFGTPRLKPINSHGRCPWLLM